MPPIDPSPLSPAPESDADDGLIEDVYRDQAAGLTRWITGLTRDLASAEDIVGEAFLRLARELAAERAAAVRIVLASLPPAERMAIALAAEGVGGPEIADRIGRTPLATRALLFRARRRIRPLLLEADAW
jgi:DNA-directed RNA polymerase specialized sigma24 family protein